jgi:hypothetical protein
MKQSMTEDADAEGEINQIVFAELVTHVVETQRGSTGGVVFKLAFKLLYGIRDDKDSLYSLKSDSL